MPGAAPRRDASTPMNWEINKKTASHNMVTGLWESPAENLLLLSNLHSMQGFLESIEEFPAFYIVVKLYSGPELSSR